MRLRSAPVFASVFLCCPALTGCAQVPSTPGVVAAGLSGAPDHLGSAAEAKVGLWANAGNVIFGQNSKGNQTITAINTGKDGCSAPNGIKVDHSNNLWVACTQFNSEYGALLKYAARSDSLAATFDEPVDCGSGCTFEWYAFDVAFDSHGHLFAGTYSQTCDPTCENSYPALWWNEGSPSSPASGISDPNIDAASWIDVDGDGNLYLSGQGCRGDRCGIVVDEIADPTSPSATVTNLMFVTSSASQLVPYALYISNHGTVMNLTDPYSRTIAQYALPWIANESPFRTLGPTLANYYGEGYPEGGGFDRGDKLLAIGDAFGWIDVGKVKNNRWSMTGDANLNTKILDAAYVPSDK
jgi:hypothetical protein